MERIKNTLTNKTINLFILLTFYFLASGQNVFIGDGDGNTWEDPDNWSLGHVPNGEDAEIDGWDVSITEFENPTSILLDNFSILTIENGVTVTTSNIQNLGESTIENNGIIEINSSTTTAFTNDGTSYIYNHSNGTINIGNTGFIAGDGLHNYNNSEFYNYGDIIINDVSGSAIVNDLNSSFSNESGGDITIGSTASIGDIGIDNKGGSYFDIMNGSSLIIDNITNRSIYNRSGSEIYNNSFTFNLGVNNPVMNTNLTNDGIFTNDLGGVIEVFGSNHPDGAVFNSSSGVFKGIGSVNMNTNDMKTDGKLTPGFSPGKITVSGNLIHSASSIDTFEIEGTAGPGVTSGHDQVNTTNGGDLVLDGTLVVSLLGGFVPSSTDQFVIFNYSGTLTGTFATVLFPTPQMIGWMVDYSTPGQVVIRHETQPLFLLNFEAKADDEAVLLYWETSDEFQIDHFEVERKTGQNQWLLLGTKNASNKKGKHKYQFWDTDLHPVEKTIFYRLKTIDIDGSFMFSKIIKLSIENKEKGVVILFPNPSSGNFFIEANSDILEAKLLISDLNGKKIKEQAINLKKNIPAQMKLDKSGQYQLIIIKEKNRTCNKSILIK